MDYLQDFYKAKEDTNGAITKNQFCNIVLEWCGMEEGKKAIEQLKKYKKMGV